MTTELSQPASRAQASLGQAPTARPSQAGGFGAALDTAQAALAQPAAAALPGQALPGSATPGGAAPTAVPAGATATLSPEALAATVTLPTDAPSPPVAGAVGIPSEPIPTAAEGAIRPMGTDTPAQQAAPAGPPAQPEDIGPNPAAMPLQPAAQDLAARPATPARADEAGDVEEKEPAADATAAPMQASLPAPLLVPALLPALAPALAPALVPGDAMLAPGVAPPAEGLPAPIPTADGQTTQPRADAAAIAVRPAASPETPAPETPAPDALPAAATDTARETSPGITKERLETLPAATQAAPGDAPPTQRAEPDPLPAAPTAGGMAAPATNAPAQPAPQQPLAAAPPLAPPPLAPPPLAPPALTPPPATAPPRFYAMPDPAAPAQQLGPILAAHASQRGGMSRLMVTLRPAELGAVEIAVESMADGPSQIRILAERPETLHLLQRDRGALEQALQRAGIEPSADGLSLGLSDPGSRDSSAQSGQAQDRRGEGQRDAPRNPWRQGGTGFGQDTAATPIALPGRHARGLLDLAL